MPADVDGKLEALREELASGDAGRQKKAARELGRMGPRAKAAIPWLLQDIERLAPDLAKVFAAALRKIDPHGRRLRELLVRSVVSLASVKYVLARTPRALPRGEPAATAEMSESRGITINGPVLGISLPERAEYAPVPEAERFTDLVVYAGEHYASEDLTQVPPMADDDPLVAGNTYTLAVALRKDRIGVDAGNKAPRPVQKPRKGTEPVDVFVLVKAFLDEVVFTDTLAKLVWPYDRDSTSACLRFQTPEFFGHEARGQIEVRLYDQSLDLLDLVLLDVSVLPATAVGVAVPAAPRRSLQWPTAQLSIAHADTPPRLASIKVTETTGGFELQFLFRNAAGDDVRVLFERDISSGDLEDLLARVRDFWTSLVIKNYARNLSVSAGKYEEYLHRLRELGTDAWSLLFGVRTGDQEGTPERIGELLAALEGGDGERIQIVHGGNVRAFIFPWSLLHPPSQAAAVDPLQFWGARFQIEQVSGAAGPDPQLGDEPVRVGFALDRNFANSATQPAMFDAYEERAASRLIVSDPVSDEAGLLAQLTHNPAAHLLYFFCHGYAASRRNGLRPNGVQRLETAIEEIKDPDTQNALATLLDLTKRMGDESCPQ